MDIFRLKTINNDKSRKVILISLDGFRHDYIELTKARNISLPTFDSIQSQGVRAMQVKNAFPTITLPNHQTLVTGLYPESHGIVLNNFIDPKYPNKMFEMDNQDNLNEEFWFENMPEPIWVTLQKTGRFAGSLLWPITDAPFSKDLPFVQVSQFTLLDGLPAQYSYAKRVTDVIWWLTRPVYNLDLILMYFDEPDETGHSYGPNSLQVANKVAELDKHLGELLNKLIENNLQNDVDIIITADHGMSQLSSDRVIEMDRYVDPNLYDYTLLTPIGAIYPKKDADLLFLYSKLKGAHPNMQVFLKGEVPQDLNYNKNSRIAPLILLADNGWSIIHNKTHDNPGNGGNHGYNNSEPDVHPFFLAIGKSFRQSYQTPLIHMVDIYPLMCHLLNLSPQPNNGSLQRISSILNVNNNHHHHQQHHLLPFPSSDWFAIFDFIWFILSWFLKILLFIFCINFLLRKIVDAKKLSVQESNVKV